LESRFIKFFYIIVGLIPISWLLLVSITYFKVGIEIGHLPTYNNPDSGQFKLFLKYDSIWNFGLLFISMWGVIIIPILLSLHKILPNYFNRIPKLQIKDAVFGYIGYLIFIIFWTIPPMSGIVTWYID
jgi:hypothetical protein